MEGNVGEGWGMVGSWRAFSDLQKADYAKVDKFMSVLIKEE